MEIDEKRFWMDASCDIPGDANQRKKRPKGRRRRDVMLTKFLDLFTV